MLQCDAQQIAVELRIKGTIVKIYALAAAFALSLGLATPASAIQVLDNNTVTATVARTPDLVAHPGGVMLTNVESSELPEPEVFAMMLIGLVLIGYRASRDGGEKFK